MSLFNHLRYNFFRLIGSRILENDRHLVTKLSQLNFSDANLNSKTDNLRTDMEELFLDNRVRYLLKALTGYNAQKVFAKKSLDNLNSPKYRFMTDEQYKMEIDLADMQAEKLLQMPPVKYSQNFEPRVFEKDIAIQGYMDPSIKIILLDASPGFNDNERLIVVREADGTLREATREERHRTNQIFYPVEERHIDLPKMFDEPQLTDMFERGAYKLFLDNLCLHFEPEDPKYNDYCTKVYEHIASNKNFDHLWSTRHYGGMVFYYVFNNCADPLLYHFITEHRINDANNLLNLFYIVNPRNDVLVNIDPIETSFARIHQIESSKTISMDKFLDLLKIYIKMDSKSNLKSRLELLLQKLTAESEENKNVAKN